MHRPKIFVGIPTREVLQQSVAGKLADLLLRFTHDKEFDVHLARMAGYPVDRVRNRLVEEFLGSDCEYLLMIDDDIVPPDDVLGMARHDKDIVAALCYAWNESIGIFPVAYERIDRPLREYRRPAIGVGAEKRGLLPMDLVGTGCMMVHRRVFAKLARPFFKSVMDEACVRLVDSEDFYFCKQARAAGLEIFLDTDRVCSHLKTVDLREVALWAETLRAAEERRGPLRMLRAGARGKGLETPP